MEPTIPVYIWIVFNFDGTESQFFAATEDSPPENISEFVSETSNVVKLSPADTETVAQIWTEAQE